MLSSLERSQHECYTLASQIYISLLKRKYKPERSVLMKFMEFMMIRVRLTLLPLPPPWVENEFLNYIVADKTLDFIVNLLSRGHRTLRNKS